MTLPTNGEHSRGGAWCRAVASSHRVSLIATKQREIGVRSCTCDRKDLECVLPRSCETLRTDFVHVLQLLESSRFYAYIHRMRLTFVSHSYLSSNEKRLQSPLCLAIRSISSCDRPAEEERGQLYTTNTQNPHTVCLRRGLSIMLNNA